MKRVGLTGGIASGKSTVAALLRERGVSVIDADEVSREVVAPGSEGLAAIIDAFGAGVLRPDGQLDREALGRIVMADPDARATLDGLTHPRIRAEIARRLQTLAEQGAPLAVIEAALLVETGSFADYDAIILVRCRPETQLARLQARQGWSSERAARWLAAQLSAEDKLDILRRAEASGGPAVVVIDNDGDPGALRAAVDAACGDLVPGAPALSR